MKKLILSAAVVAFALGTGFASTAMAGKSAPVDISTAKDHKVFICHFPGHEGDALITGAGFGCENAGGEILEVSKKAAANGHGIEDE